jgi:SDR family mycofactocin-dependent oxidoreductase
MGALDGRVAFITGGARGQGRAHALALAAEGANVVIADAPRPMNLTYPLGTEDDLRATAKEVEELGGLCLPMVLDVRDDAAVKAAVDETVSSLGSLDILVANAGVVSTGPLDEVTDETWHQLVDTNLTGAFHTLRAVIPVMRRQRFGRIVITSSMGGRMGIPDLAPYNATKWGVIGLAKSVALEVAKEGITVNVICPTTVNTPMVQPFGADAIPDEFVQRMMRANPIPAPWIESEDVSRGLMYLVTDPGVVTGSVLEIALGASAGHEVGRLPSWHGDQRRDRPPWRRDRIPRRERRRRHRRGDRRDGAATWSGHVGVHRLLRHVRRGEWGARCALRAGQCGGVPICPASHGSASLNA